MFLNILGCSIPGPLAQGTAPVPLQPSGAHEVKTLQRLLLLDGQARGSLPHGTLPLHQAAVCGQRHLTVLYTEWLPCNGFQHLWI